MLRLVCPRGFVSRSRLVEHVASARTAQRRESPHGASLVGTPTMSAEDEEMTYGSVPASSARAPTLRRKATVSAIHYGDRDGRGFLR